METTTGTRRPGRPAGSGVDDGEAVRRVEAMLRENSSLSSRQAIVEVLGSDHPAGVRRVERKLRERRLVREKDDALLRRANEAIVDPGRSLPELRAIAAEMGIDLPMDQCDLETHEDLVGYARHWTSLSAIVRLNAHDTAFRHDTNAMVVLDREDDGIRLRLSGGGTGRMEIVSPPREGDVASRMAALAWERTQHAVVLSPEEKASWDATDGAWWRLVNDITVPRWQKILAGWRRPDMSMTEALRDLADLNGIRAERSRVGGGDGADPSGPLSFETRDPVPASRIVSLPRRIAGRLVGEARNACVRVRYWNMPFFPLVDEDVVCLFPGDHVALMRSGRTVYADSLGPGDLDIHVRFEERRREGRIVRRPTMYGLLVVDRKTGLNVDDKGTLRVLRRLECAIGKSERLSARRTAMRWTRRAIFVALLFLAFAA